MRTLKELRIANGLTQIEVAQLFKVSSRTIQNMEKDSSNIKDRLLSKYIIAFQVSYNDIFSLLLIRKFRIKRREKEINNNKL